MPCWLSLSTYNIGMDTTKKDSKVCRHGSSALRPVPLLDADTLVQPLQERFLESLHVHLHVGLVAR